eukprot:380239-Rhodomonas_salina.2
MSGTETGCAAIRWSERRQSEEDRRELELRHQVAAYLPAYLPAYLALTSHPMPSLTQPSSGTETAIILCRVRYGPSSMLRTVRY